MMTGEDQEARVEGALQRQLRELRFLERVVRAFATSDDHDAVMRSVVHETTEATGTQVCSLYIWDEQEQQLILTATNGLSPLGVGSVKLALGGRRDRLGRRQPAGSGRGRRP